MDLARVRNFGIAAHIDAGKTTLSERILFDAGVEHRYGDVDDGTTVLDWMQEERERGITITAAATTLPWRGHTIHLIDTPGHVDFTIEVERSMRVLDGAVLVIDAALGVQAQSEMVWRQMRRHHVPFLVFVNKLDRPGADFLRAAQDVRRRLGVPAIPVQYPLFDESADGNPRRVVGIVDLLDLRTLAFQQHARESHVRTDPIPASAADEVGVLAAELLDALAEDDEGLLEEVVAGRRPARDVLARALRRRVLAGTLVPVLCGVALHNVGIHPLLDAVVDWLPSPLDAPPIVGRDPATDAAITRAPRADEPFCALAFKLQALPHGEWTFARVYSGTVEAGGGVWNPRTRHMERVGRILRVHANHGEGLERASAGDIVAFTGLKHTSTGDTLCAREAPIVLESLVPPEAVLSLVLEPGSTVDRDKLRVALQRLAHEDPSLRVREDPDTGQWIVSGMGELHLEVVQHRLRDEFKVAASVGQPRVAYRESVVSGAAGRAQVERSVGGKDLFGAVELVVAADPGSSALPVEWAPDCPVPSAFRRALAEGLAVEAQVGPRLGFPLVHARVRVTGGASDPRRDAEQAFVQAGVLALREALGASHIALLEPWMSFEIQVPAEFSSGLIADLNTRRAQVESVQAEGPLRLLRGTVALSRMFGYATAARSQSQGRAAFSMIPAGYRPVPEDELVARGLVWT